MTLEEISKLSAQEAITILNDHISAHPQDEEAHILRGKFNWALQNRSKAINDYLKAVALNPDSRAKQALEHINAILDFYNKDLYNP